MDTKVCSECIMKSLDYIDSQIESLAEGSVNKERLHGQVHMQLVIRVKTLFGLSESELKTVLDHIFKTELNNEIVKKWTES